MTIDSVAMGVLVHVDAALRQLTFSDQLQVAEEIRRRIDTRMHPTDRERRIDAHTCGEKHRHATKEEAEARRIHKPNAARLEVYGPCAGCAGYHLGHKRKARA